MNLFSKQNKQKNIHKRTELSWPRVRDIQGIASGGKRAACAFITNKHTETCHVFLGQC